MSQTNEAKNINMGLTSDVPLASAKTYNILERRRITLAVHQTPESQLLLSGNVHIYGSIHDDDAWYVLLGTINLNTWVEKVEYFNIINSITNGAALRMIRVVIDSLQNGSIDIKLFEMKS